MAKKRKAMKKNSVNGKTDEKTSNGLKVYKVNGSQNKVEKITRREKTVQSFLIVLIVVLAIAAIFSAIQTFAPGLFGKMSLGGELAARVNGAPITMQQLEQDYNRLPLQYKYYVTEEQFLSQLIDETLMVQEARAEGIIVTNEEIDQSISDFMQDGNVTEEKLNEILKEKDLIYEELRVLIMNQLLIDKLLEQEVRSNIEVNSKFALQYYNDNPDSFRIPELVKVRHILIGTSNRTEDDAKERADMVSELVKNDTARFCSYVVLYTDDSGSVDTCGEYNFPRGQMVEEFETKAFEQEEGDISIVQTEFGFHIIETLNKTPEQLISFKDVEEQIYAILEDQQEKILYSDFIVSLREKAEIINYLEQEEEVAETEGTEDAEGTEEGEPEVVVEEPEEEGEAAAATTVNVTAPEEETAEETDEVEELDEELAQEQEELEEEVEKTIEEIVEEEPVEEVVEEVPMEDLTFAQCLTKKGAILYGAYWDSSTTKQKNQFGSDISNINYIECGLEGDYRAQELVCKEAGILAYPTWIINSEMHMGILSPEQLSSLTGCER